jgi:hypothetical protein
MKKQGSITGLAQEVFMEYVEKSSAYDFAINQLLIDIKNEFNAVYDSADIDFTIESLPLTAQEEFIKRAFQIVV